jgi:hypothetical protein
MGNAANDDGGLARATVSNSYPSRYGNFRSKSAPSSRSGGVVSSIEVAVFCLRRTTRLGNGVRPRRRRSFLYRASRSERLKQVKFCHRFDQMCVEACLCRALSILSLAPSGECDERGAPTP